MSRALAVALLFAVLAVPAAAWGGDARGRFYLIAGARYAEFASDTTKLALPDGESEELEIVDSEMNGGHIAVGWAPGESWFLEARVHYGEGDFEFQRMLEPTLVASIPIMGTSRVDDHYALLEEQRYDGEFRSWDVELNAFWYPLTGPHDRARPPAALHRRGPASPRV